MNTKLALGIVVLALVIVGGYWYWQSSSPVVPQVTQQSAQQNSVTAGEQKTYTNPLFDYTFSYPTTWKVSEDGAATPHSLIYLDSPDRTVTYTPGGAIDMTGGSGTGITIQVSNISDEKARGEYMSVADLIKGKALPNDEVHLSTIPVTIDGLQGVEVRYKGFNENDHLVTQFDRGDKTLRITLDLASGASIDAYHKVIESLTFSSHSGGSF